MGCLKILNNSKLFAIAGGTKYHPLAVAYKREWLLDESINDAHGNMLSMPHLSSMQWDFANRLKSATNGTFTSYYNYDSGGERSRKVVDKGNIREERYYIGGYEVFRKYVNNSLDTERTTLHVMDDTKTVALIETNTLQSSTTIRYQYDNHLGSACLELDEYADIISYEEYHPFGTTSYRSGRTETEVSLKRYKYVGKERDEETGLYYYGARYYAAWLCRFVSVDPLQHEYPDLTPFQYASNRPITGIDLDGLEFIKPEEAKIRLGNKSINWNSENISIPLKNALSENILKSRNKYDSPEPSGEIHINIKISDFDINMYFKNKMKENIGKSFDMTKYKKSYQLEDNGEDIVNENSNTFSPTHYNSTRVAKSTKDYDKRYNQKQSPIWWTNGSKMGGRITAITEALKFFAVKYGNYKIKEDVQIASDQSKKLYNSLDLYYKAEQSGLIPNEAIISPDYKSFQIDVINYIFCGELPLTSRSLSYKDKNNNQQTIWNENYRKLVTIVGSTIWNNFINELTNSIEKTKNTSIK